MNPIALRNTGVCSRIAAYRGYGSALPSGVRKISASSASTSTTSTPTRADGTPRGGALSRDEPAEAVQRLLAHGVGGERAEADHEEHHDEHGQRGDAGNAHERIEHGA